jgi:hypothetical protein
VGITPDVDVAPPKETIASITQEGGEFDENPEIHERDLPHHFQNGQKKGDKSAAPDDSAAPATGPDKGTKGPGAKGAKAKEEKDVQLDRAIDILKHWNTFKLQLAKGELQSASAAEASKSKGD